jgi:hypothetical protein
MTGMTKLTILEAGAMRSLSHRTLEEPMSILLITLSHVPTPDHVKRRIFKK